MAARAIWKAVIDLGGAELPVKLYSAVVDRSVHFHLLHDQDMVRVRQKMVNPSTGEEVPAERRRKGVPIEPGRFVLVDDEELAELEPKASRTISVERFIPVDAVGHEWFDRPYYLGPDGDIESYWAVVAALAAEQRQGLARWVMRRREYVGALRAERGGLMLLTMRHAGEVLPMEQLDAPEGRRLEPKELKMAGQLVGALEDEFAPEEWHDEYRERVMELIEAKAEGRTVEVETYEPRPAPGASLSEALEASLAAARGNGHG